MKETSFKKRKLENEPRTIKCKRYMAKEISPKNKRYLEENIFCIFLESSKTIMIKNAPKI